MRIRTAPMLLTDSSRYHEQLLGTDNNNHHKIQIILTSINSIASCGTKQKKQLIKPMDTTHTSTHRNKYTTINVGYKVCLTANTSPYTSACTVNLVSPVTTSVTSTPTPTISLVILMPPGIKSANTTLSTKTCPSENIRIEYHVVTTTTTTVTKTYSSSQLTLQRECRYKISPQRMENLTMNIT